MITFESVNKKFGKSHVLKDITFSIKQNEIVGIIGNNGAGKSTLIHLMANLLPIDSGELFIFGKELTPNNLSYKSKTGFILSKPYYIEDFSIKEYMKFVGKFQDIPSEILRKRSRDLIEKLNFTEPEKPISKLSKGNQMKVSIIASLVHNPSLLLYDEPFINLDIDSQEILKSLLNSMKGRKTILITSQNIDLVLDVCDRFLVIDDGKLILDKQKRKSNEDIKTEIIGLMSKNKSVATPDWLK